MPDFDTRVDYGKQSWKGSWANTDRFAIDDRGNYISEVDIFYIKSDAGFPQPASGIIGLAKPNESMMISPNMDRTSKKMFLENFAETNGSQNKTSFSTAFTASFPQINLGEPDVRKYREDETPVNLTANKDFFWSLSTSGIRIGESGSRAYSFAADP
jgi:hypothetical protein